ncbi:hypothetical protein [Glacieibacterium sp.]|uniref:hypothetical protein n=1 Tax=Glacieibacterium sp. TaxID=2860237 RepID=UPI003B0051AB
MSGSASTPLDPRTGRSRRMTLAIGVCALATAGAAPRDVADVRVVLARAPTATIQQGSLKAVIALPDPDKGFYRGTRFDWSGMIVEVQAGGTRFYGPWFDGIAANVRDFIDSGTTLVVGPQTSATGPAEEFFGPAAAPVPGYGEAPVGGTFIKIGVGRLRKADDRPYDRFRGYNVVDGGTWKVSRTGSSVAFRQEIVPDAAGYGYRYEKTVRLARGGVLEIAHRLVNTGSKRVVTEVYNHNFTRFDDRDIGPEVSVEYPYPLTSPTSTPQLAEVEGSTLRYRSGLAAGERVTLAPDGFTQDARTSGFTINGPGGAQVHASSDTPIVSSQLWSVRTVVSVEPFTAIDLAPGAEKRWVWRYSFKAGDAPRP